VTRAARQGFRYPPAPVRGPRRPSHLRQQPRVSLGTAGRSVTHDRTVARLSIAWTRQVTVTNLICGVDVSCATLEARLGRDGAVKRFGRSAAGIAALAAWCKEHQVAFVAMEATGGYEKLPFGLLWAEGVPAAIVNPRAVRRFAEAMGILEKTDRIDTGVIAWFAEVKRIVPQSPASDAQQRLTALVTRLRQLTELRTAQSNQRRLVTDPTVRGTFDALRQLVSRQIRSLEAHIAQLIDGDPLWQKLDASFRTIKGVADRTVARLMAELPEIGTLSNKAAAKLTGLAPIARDSGKLNGKRPVRGGRSGIRSILFVVAEVVRRYDPDFADCHRRLTQAGKPKKLIRVALARKLLVRLNAKARDVRCALAKPA
jgi:transposase